MTIFQYSELTELTVVENSQLFVQRTHSARYAPPDRQPRPFYDDRRSNRTPCNRTHLAAAQEDWRNSLRGLVQGTRRALRCPGPGPGTAKAHSGGGWSSEPEGMAGPVQTPNVSGHRVLQRVAVPLQIHGERRNHPPRTLKPAPFRATPPSPPSRGEPHPNDPSPPRGPHDGHCSAPHMHALVCTCSNVRQFLLPAPTGSCGMYRLVIGSRGSLRSGAPCCRLPALFRCLAIILQFVGNCEPAVGVHCGL